MAISAFGAAARQGSLRSSVLLVGSYAAALCWLGSIWMLASIPGLLHAPGWFLAPPAVLTFGLVVVWLQGRERPVRRKPQHLHERARHAVRPSQEPAPLSPRSPLSTSLLMVSVYTAALSWAGLFLMAWNGAAWALGSALLVLPLLATLLAIFAWGYRGRPHP